MMLYFGFKIDLLHMLHYVLDTKAFIFILYLFHIKIRVENDAILKCTYAEKGLFYTYII